ncbi:hypothetical protein QJS10_CPA08g00997 [Acorus calamus]|uniref:Uncharacterized protein n=1 Tax=Acorus calamus TaxID=4465 RepID=A0AAV9EDN3_ACOCL|nr:hypothetical protein QJS10_CPA08g00997 [Acorus calamus]
MRCTDQRRGRGRRQRWQREAAVEEHRSKYFQEAKKVADESIIEVLSTSPPSPFSRCSNTGVQGADGGNELDARGVCGRVYGYASEQDECQR